MHIHSPAAQASLCCSNSRASTACAGSGVAFWKCSIDSSCILLHRGRGFGDRGGTHGELPGPAPTPTKERATTSARRFTVASLATSLDQLLASLRLPGAPVNCSSEPGSASTICIGTVELSSSRRPKRCFSLRPWRQWQEDVPNGLWIDGSAGPDAWKDLVVIWAACSLAKTRLLNIEILSWLSWSLVVGILFLSCGGPQQLSNCVSLLGFGLW